MVINQPNISVFVNILWMKNLFVAAMIPNSELSVKEEIFKNTTRLIYWMIVFNILKAHKLTIMT